MNSATSKAPGDEMVIDMACESNHAWSHDAAKDPFAAVCPSCGLPAAFQISAPRARGARTASAPAKARLDRDDVAGIVPGAWVQSTFDIRGDGRLLPEARWSSPRIVVEVFGRGISVKGRAYVCFWTSNGPGSQMSRSTAEGEEDLRLCPPPLAC
jgi:hypothetical protein